MRDNGTRPGAGARRKSPVVDTVGGEFTAEERRLGRYCRAAYVVNRSAFESAKAGTEMRWQVPAKYDGKLKPSNDPQDKNRKARNVWYEMGRWMLRHKVEPIAFVQYVFARLDIANRIPEPAQVCSEAHLPGFHKYVTEGVVQQISQEFEVQARTAKAAMKSVRDAFGAIDPDGAAGKKWVIVQNVILSKTVQLSPLFRYLLARSSAKEAGDENDEEAKYRFLDFAQKFYDRAVVQFCSHKDAYAEHWKKWLPKRFPADAEERFRLLAFNEEAGDENQVV